MKWKKRASDWWWAQGKFVVFSLFREHGVWKGYCKLSDGKCFNLPWRRSLNEMKELCENNVHWEDKE
ncbi:MAG: hypothetical protein K2N23_00295 [Clostridia bacterium]|nr:hypothetical protein [Clostridia bacterium]